MVNLLIGIAALLSLVLVVRHFKVGPQVRVVQIDKDTFAIYMPIKGTNTARLVGVFNGDPHGENVENPRLTTIWSMTKPIIIFKE